MRDSVPWPKEAADHSRDAGYWRGRPLGAYLHDWAETYGDAVAVVDGDTRLTYRQLAARADGLACHLLLLDLGLNPGDAMLVQLPNGWEFVTLTLACLRAGVAPVMALPAHRGHELRYLAAHSEVTSIVVPDRLGEFDHQARREVAEVTSSVRLLLVAGDVIDTDATDLRALAEPADDPTAARARLDRIAPDSGDIAVLLLSGGTTGLPKLITRTHDDYEYNARRSAEVCDFDRDTAYLVALPAGHNFTLACLGLLGTLMNGGRVVLARTPDPDKVLPLMSTEGVTATAAVPAVVQRWIDAVATSQQTAPPALRLLQVGARLAPEVARRVEPVLGGTLQQVFGMAEGLLNYTRPSDPEDIKIESQGRPMCPDDEILVVDASDNPVPPGGMGALLTRGPYSPRGYYRADERNARAFTPDGWYRTGDIVRLHPSGNLVVEGRDKDMINRGGEKISAEEVENLIYRLPGVARVAAVAKPDPYLGERVCAVVVAEQGADRPSNQSAPPLPRCRWPATSCLRRFRSWTNYH
ncbi:(2,3-dihydroxybenzoyl)adenylate synthase [Streptomyces lincolnensis]|uniref:(2,3-dihydroxybenzoyl)adenylate synthase n=1 Tax=Streptomyces TaxID=1883 RepID=UPI001E61CF18|nr:MULTISPECIES: AMP-binding protein [Streptomyces]WLW50872.1 AMP-binding protein [Streptomyces coralus]